ncbi:signal peptidase I [bacterium]|nr:signal peptidase I [bacterium]MBU4123537.1 signal peptidase I [bacterium]
MEQLVFFISLGIGAVYLVSILREKWQKIVTGVIVWGGWAIAFWKFNGGEWPKVVALTTLGCLPFLFEVYPRKYAEAVRQELNSFFQTLLIVSVLMYFIIQAFKIPSGSMMNTYLIGDHLFACKFRYGWHIPLTKKYIKFTSPKRGDVIIFKYPLDPKKDFIKRCIGLPGESVEIINKQVYINGKKLIEDYTQFADGEQFLPASRSVRDNYGPAKIPEDCFFVMGDNRDRSMDSRFWGCLERRYIRGKALFTYWPPKRIAGGRHERPQLEN